MHFLNHTLDNGLTVVAECNPEAYSMGLGFFVQTGSRDESDSVWGVSHFLEHMAFKGTSNRSADDVNREFDEMGADYNAFTSEENTVYYAAVLPEYQEQCAGLLADLMHPSLREEDFDTEKQVIIEEIRMYDDQPPFGADDKCKVAYFGDHPLSRSVLGTVESITALTVDQMRNYFANRYSPGNITLAAAGRLDFDRLVAQAEQVCGAWESVIFSRHAPRAEPRESFQTIRRDSATQQYALQMTAGPATGDEDRYAAKLLATVIGDDSGSRMYWDLVDSGLAENASLGHYEYQGTGLFAAYMSCDPQRTADNLQRMLEIYRVAERDGITEEELNQAKSKVKAHVVLGSERPRNRLFSVGGNWVSRREYRAVKDDIDAVDGVKLDNVHAVLAKYPLSVNTTVAIGPLDELKQPS